MPYAAFVAPALLASSAMNGAVFDTTFNVFFKLKYSKLYDAVLATPLGPRDVAVGEITLVAAARRALLGGVPARHAVRRARASRGGRCSPLPAAVLIGFAFAGGRAWSPPRTCGPGSDFDYVNLAILPMFLFSATFFPLSTYPDGAAVGGRRSPRSTRASRSSGR